MVYPWDVIEPFDAHIDNYREQVQKKWTETIPLIVGANKYDIMVFYSGGCPREPYIELLRPILGDHGIALLTFGRPNMYDIDKTEQILEWLVQGTRADEIKGILKCPDRFYFIQPSSSLLSKNGFEN
jgi:hypothetical protein